MWPNTCPEYGREAGLWFIWIEVWLDVKSMNIVALHAIFKRMNVRNQNRFAIGAEFFIWLTISPWNRPNERINHHNFFHFVIGINWFTITEIECPEWWYKYRSMNVNGADSFFLLLLIRMGCVYICHAMLVESYAFWLRTKPIWWSISERNNPRNVINVCIFSDVYCRCKWIWKYFFFCDSIASFRLYSKPSFYTIGQGKNARICNEKRWKYKRESNWHGFIDMRLCSHQIMHLRVFRCVRVPKVANRMESGMSLIKLMAVRKLCWRSASSLLWKALNFKMNW